MAMRIRQSFWSSLPHSEIKKIIPSPRRWRAWAYAPMAAVFMVLLALRSTAFAGSATWIGGSPDCPDCWLDDIPGNWIPGTVPNGPADTATFDVSNVTAVEVGLVATPIEVNGIVFNAGASAFTLTVLSIFTGADQILTISGVGITNNSGIIQNFVTAFGASPGVIEFTNSATAGTLTVFTNTREGATHFFDTSSAGNATLINEGGPFFSSPGSETNFFDSATADNATVIANGGVSGAVGGSTNFQNNSPAGNATLIANGGSGGGPGGVILFNNDSSGGTARVKVSDNGSLDISAHNAPGVTIGSLEGDGLVSLGANNLTVGSNDRSTAFSGVVEDAGTGGVLTKIGTGTLVLTNANLYTGGTIINGGKLVVNNGTGSSTGTGLVQVNVGRLGGAGIIDGPVTVGTGSSSQAIILPGKTAGVPGILTINSALTFNSLSTYKCVLNRSHLIAGEITALGVTINSGATFTFVDVRTGTLTVGTVFIVINNTSASPISGSFSNLADGLVFTSNGNNFQASYTGGDGNDLTLSVVP